MEGAPMGVRFESPHSQPTPSKSFLARGSSRGNDFPESQVSHTLLPEQFGNGTTGASGGGGIVPQRHINVLKGYSDATRLKSVRVPAEGTMMRITSVVDIYRTVRILVSMISNAWAWTFSSSGGYQMVLPALGRIHVGSNAYVVPGYLLADLEPMCHGHGSERPSAPAYKSFSSPTMPDFHLRHPIRHFPHMLVLLKLRFLLRLHSAGCEMDYKMCSFKVLIQGLQYVILQQHAAVESDNIFQSNVSQPSAGSHFNLESVVDDIFDQLQRALGAAWRPFLEFVFTCDPHRSVHSSKMESGTPKIASNRGLAVILDTIFVAHFLRQPRKSNLNNLRLLYDDLELLRVPLPQLPPLQDARHLRAWAKAQSRPTRQDREKVAGKDYEKLAQLDAVLLTAVVELHLPEAHAGPNETSESTVNNIVNTAELAPELSDSPGGSGPKAARVILVDKPQVSSVLFDAAMHSIHHHATFPDGIRERIYNVLSEEYGITQEQSQRLAIAVTQNIDGNRLPESVLLGMEHREKVRLRDYQAATNRNTSHLLVAPLVPCPIDKGKPPKYTTISPGVAPSTSCPSFLRTGAPFRSSSAPHLPGREPFKVPMTPGPLTYDPEKGVLRNTGFFNKTSHI